jgi:hypothetical protein
MEPVSMRRFAVRMTAVLACLAAGIGVARATETVDCAATDDSDALVTMNVGVGLPAELPNWVRVSDGDLTWSTLDLDAGDNTTMVSLFQAFDDGRLMSVDLSDTDVTAIVVSIRILRATEGERTVYAGTLHIPGKAVHPLACSSGDAE